MCEIFYLYMLDVEKVYNTVYKYKLVRDNEFTMCEILYRSNIENHSLERVLRI